MATSGTYSFTMTRDDIIGAALRLVGAFGDTDPIPGSDITNCAQALNILTKELVVEGLPLWAVLDFSTPLVQAQASYNLSLLTGQTLPQRVLDAYIVDSSGNTTMLDSMSRYDYDQLGMKNALGTPNQWYYDPQLSAGAIVLYEVPDGTPYTLHVVIQRQFQDFNLSTDNADFPQEAFRLLKWCLADEISLEYKAPEKTQVKIERKAKEIKEAFFDYNREQASVIFQPSGRKY